MRHAAARRLTGGGGSKRARQCAGRACLREGRTGGPRCRKEGPDGYCCSLPTWLVHEGSCVRALLLAGRGVRICVFGDVTRGPLVS